MTEVFDKLLIRILFTFFICIGLLIYKYAHTIFYPSQRKQVMRKIYPSENPADTLHIFARIIGVSIVFSALEFNEHIGLYISTFHFFVWGTIGFTLYLLSIYLMENIIFFNFEYVDEVLKKKNMAYSIVSFSMAISLAYLLRKVFQEAESSIIILLLLWLFAVVLLGFATKLFKYVSKLSFNGLMIQKNIGLGISYAAYLFSATILIAASFSHEHHDLISYGIQVILKTLLGALILPIFMKGIKYVFKIQEDEDEDEKGPDTLAIGIYEGSVFLSSSMLTCIIIGQIHFGTIYPFF